MLSDLLNEFGTLKQLKTRLELAIPATSDKIIGKVVKKMGKNAEINVFLMFRSNQKLSKTRRNIAI